MCGLGRYPQVRGLDSFFARRKVDDDGAKTTTKRNAGLSTAPHDKNRVAPVEMTIFIGWSR
jgi:hypothetical protein